MSNCFENGDSEKELRMVLLGSSGSGKSRTGNTLLGSDVFSFGPQSVSVQSTSNQRFGRIIQVVDTPGCNISDKTKMRDDLKEILDMTKTGPNAFLLCIPVGRFTNEVAEDINCYYKCYGSNFFNFTIVLFTQIDYWREDMDDLGNNCRDFDKYIANLPETAKSILRKCNDRYIPLDNTIEQNDDIIKNIFEEITKLMRYNDPPFFKVKSITDTVKSYMCSALSFVKLK